MNRFPTTILATYRDCLVFAISASAVLCLSRLLLILLYWERVDAVQGLSYILIQGLRFDLLVICALLLPVAVLASLFGSRRRWLVLQRSYLVGVFVLLVFMEAATPTFVAEYDLRPNVLFVEYLKYPKEVLGMLLGGYKTDLVFGLSLVGMVGYGFLRLLRRGDREIDSMGWWRSGICAVLVLVLCAMGARSSLGHRPANPSTVAFSTDLLVNELSLSSLYSAMYAMYRESRHERGVQGYGEMDFAEIVREVRQDMALPTTDFLSSELPTLHRSQWIKPLDQPLNLVIILQESLGAEFVGALGGVDVTPRLDALSEQGVWFDNMYATGTRSVRGIEAVITGFTPTPARSVVKLPGSQQGFFTIATLLGNAGYDTSFIYGGEAHFDNMRQFFVGNGFQRIVEYKDYENPVYTGSWGVSDEDLFNRAHQEFSEVADIPFFSLVFTSSNHSPFEFPEGRIELHEQPQATVNNAVKYADHTMGEFFEQARTSSYWKNTLFLVVADHNSRVRGANLIPIEYFHIPALLLGGPVEPQVYSRMASQIDLLPTVLGLMGIDAAHPATGQDLFRLGMEDVPGRAIMQYNSTQAYMRGDDVVVMELEKPPAHYLRTDTGLQLSGQQDEALINRALAYSLWSTRAYRDNLYRLPAAH